MSQNSELTAGLIFHAPLSEDTYQSGAELVTNGGFDTDSGWTKNTGWAISGGTANHTVTAGYARIYQSNSIVAGKKYAVSFTVTSGTAYILFYLENTGPMFSDVYTGYTSFAVGTYSFIGTAANTDNNISIYSNASGGIFSIDNVSVREVSKYCTDLVSLSKGTVTDVIPVLDRQGSGRREYSFNGTSNYVALPTIAAFGTGDFTVVMKINLSKIGDNWVIGTNGSTAFNLYTNTNGYVVVGLNSNFITSTNLVTINTPLIIVYSRTSGIGSFSMNGISGGSFADVNNYTDPNKMGVNTWFGKYIAGSISMCRIFNYALTPTQIANYSKPEYPIEYADRGTGASKNILDLNAEGATSAYWYDKTNSLTATVSGATLVKPSASNLGASYFNGTSSNIAFGAGTCSNLGDMTVSFRMRRLSGLVIGQGVVISQSAYYRFYNAAEGYRLQLTRNANVNWFGPTGSETMDLNTDYIFTIVSTAAGYATIYRNGAILNGYNNVFIQTPYEGDKSISLGSSLNGNLSDLRIYNRILSADEIQLLYAGGK